MTNKEASDILRLMPKQSDAILKAIEVLESENYYKSLAESYGETINKLTTAISETKQEPRKGRWIYDENLNWRCSECNETPKTMGYVGTADFMAEHFKFCNHCGARMECD